jgi:hypothetical protein
MLNIREVLSRVLKLEAFRQMHESDFRQIVYGQEFTPAAGQSSPATPRNFPAGAIVYGITAAAFVPASALSGGRNRQGFQLDFAYNGGEKITVDGPISADALLGGGDSNIFPAKELVMGANQQIICTAKNITSAALTIDVSYHCLVYRFQG